MENTITAARRLPDAFTRPIEDAAEARGEARAVARAVARGMTNALMAILQARGISLDHAQREAITSCMDPDQLTAWTIRAAYATTADDVLADDSGS